MVWSKLLVKAATPILCILLILAGTLQLRAQNRAIAAICIAIAMIAFMMSIRFLEKTPFTTDEIDSLRPWPALARCPS